MNLVLFSGLRRKVFLASLSICLCLGASGCGNTCYVGVWNGSGAVIGVSNSSCSLAKATGSVAIHLSSVSSSDPDPGVFLSKSRAIQHIFVALRGIQAHAGTGAEEVRSDWQELAPYLAVQPVQVDLLALGETRLPLDSSRNETAPSVVTADVYRQIRFRFMPVEPLPTDALPEGNACGNAGWNCIIFNDGSLWTFSADESEFRFVPTNSDQSLFRVLPDGHTSLFLQFDPESFVALRLGGNIRIKSVFKASSYFRFPIDDQTKGPVLGKPLETLAWIFN